MKPYLVAMIAGALKQPSLCVWDGQLGLERAILELFEAIECSAGGLVVKSGSLNEGGDWTGRVTYRRCGVKYGYLRYLGTVPSSHRILSPGVFPNFLLARHRTPTNLISIITE